MTVNPVGLAGNWELVFQDNFSDIREDAGDKWTVTDWKMNNILSNPKNVWTYDGKLVLNLESAESGVHIVSKTQRITPGMVVEAKIKFPGDGKIVYNWPAFWTAGVKYPDSGEHDIAEGLDSLKVSYWSSKKTLDFSSRPDEIWTDAYHVFTLHRGKASGSVRWDGQRVGLYGTNDDGGPEYICLTLGSRGTVITGLASRVRVDYVRAWKPA